MKRLAVILLVAVGIWGLALTQNIQPADKNDKLKQEVIYLCRVNAALADKLHARLDEEEAGDADFGFCPRVFLDSKDGHVIETIPTSAFFVMVAEMLKRDRKIDHKVISELLRHNQLFLSALKNETGRHSAQESKAGGGI